DNIQDQRVDSSFSGVLKSYSLIPTTASSTFRNSGVQLSYKYNFPKPGHNFSADFNFNGSNNSNFSNLTTTTFQVNNPANPFALLQKVEGGGFSNFYTFQADYENPLSDTKKLEAGIRTAIRDFRNDNLQYRFNPSTGKFEQISAITNRYKFTDAVHAAYVTYSFKVNKWSYQLGLRAESSSYNGSLIDRDSSFTVKFPLSLFPSAFITYKVNAAQDVQINYSRRINRPNFFQLMPFPDVTDPQNINIGNAGLRPEFTHSFEASYNNNYKKGANFLVSAFFKYTNNLITRYQ
ncbi:MAG: outer membrane beta-barrel family protein, partial [Chitinophagaceae bacterium]